MRIIELTVKYAIKNKEEEARVLSFFALQRGNQNIPSDSGVAEKGVVADKAPYTPSSERTKRALEAVGRCKRVALLRPEVLETWANAYPNVAIDSEIMKCEAWAESKSITRSPRGWQKALNFWLNKEQDKTRGTNIVVTPAVTPSVVQLEPETDAWIKAAQ